MMNIKGCKRTRESLDNAEKQLRYLSSQIIAAQEIERKRISRELHDELGQALSLIKFKLSFIKKNLQDEQTLIRKECEDILEFINQVIENVRRLSRDLSPTVLDDLGLTAAIRWLINNLKTSNKKIQITSNITNIDHFFPQDAQINIYRIIQEALTNIGEHAQAKNVSIHIAKHSKVISFSIEDDGKGFNVKQALRKITIERGLGLASMAERVQMIGGVFNLCSEEGQGTQIKFTIPFKKKDL
ncbi:MAG: sensor histidine kinase [Nitrospirae bacterium]|jgi:signal transduction histidine kinase|nr:sensor histidine kinase [Nitrospirota bacterium]